MLRLTSGIFRGRMIQTPPHNTTRPTQAKVRQALFNSIQSTIPDAKVLDLFAGSGALGFESLSRGAKEVVFVENSRSVIKILQKNIQTLQVQDQVHILDESVQSALSSLKKHAPFDLILADPPYENGWELKLLETWPWEEILVPGGCFCLEWGTVKSQVNELPDRLPFLVKAREKNYGDTVLTTYIREEA